MSSEDDGHRNVKETALETRDERDPSTEDVTKLAYEQYEASKDTVSGIAGKASEIAKKIYETLRNTAALGVIGKTGKALAMAAMMQRKMLWQQHLLRLEKGQNTIERK